VRWGALLRGDNLCRLTPEGCSALVDYGVRTIIDVRSPSELGLAPHPFRNAA
jgi:protein-tyrosine phosphatase